MKVKVFLFFITQKLIPPIVVIITATLTTIIAYILVKAYNLILHFKEKERGRWGKRKRKGRKGKRK